MPDTRTHTSYTPGMCRFGAHGWSTQTRICRHCAQEPFLHAGDMRCYTLLERDAALRFFQKHRRWPAGLFRATEEEDDVQS